MMRKILFVLLFNVFFANAQTGEAPIRVFGYFQNTFQYQRYTTRDREQDSFIMQQMNLFFQKDLGRNWTALVNFELLNSFSSSRRWGAFNLEEAWVRYRAGRQFNMKLGLQIPVFNNFNEIKNRTPIIPYIIRPLIYETSFRENIAVDEYAPQSAYIQFYGFIPGGDVKIDYAVYLGNSPNITTIEQKGVSGIDSTTALLLGGRIGIRYKNLKAGLSLTRDGSNAFKGAEMVFGGPAGRFINIPRVRFGSDLSYEYERIDVSAEFINVSYRENIPAFEFEKEFYYGTIGAQLTDDLYGFFSYWKTKETVMNFIVEVVVPNVGFRFNLTDRITIKLHYAPVQVESTDQHRYRDDNFDFFAAAISVFM